MTSKMLMASLLVHLMAGVFRAHGLEEPSPAAFLQPRNFNPHPYELGYGPRRADRQVSRLRDYTDRGPILFPANNQPSDNRLIAEPYAVAKLRDAHPYADVVAKKVKEYGIQEQVNPQVYKALAAHGSKVLNVPQADDLKSIPNFVQHYDYDDETKKNYAFSYKVVDGVTGDDFSHRQSQDSRATNGEYRVKLPDGRVQIVSYTADKDGYKADVKYSGRKHTAAPQHIHAEPARHRFAPPAPAQLHVPLYADSVIHVGGNLRDDDAASDAHDFINQHLITGGRAPAMAYYEPRDDADVLFVLPDKYRAAAAAAAAAAQKVQLLPNIGEQKAHEHRKFIAATLAPYVVANGGGGGGGGALLHDVQPLSTLAPDLDNFNPVYIDAPKYKLPTTIH